MNRYQRLMTVVISIALVSCVSSVLNAGQQVLASANAIAEHTGYGVEYEGYGEHGLTIKFSSSSVFIGRSDSTVVVDDAVEGTPFKGDYIAAAVNTLSFSVIGYDGQTPGKSMIRIVGPSGKQWNYAFDVSTESGVPTVIEAPLALSSGWSLEVTTLTQDEQSALMASDLTDVVRVGVYIQASTSGLNIPAQNYTIDNFVLINDDDPWLSAASERLESQPAVAVLLLLDHLLERLNVGPDRRARLLEPQAHAAMMEGRR